MKHAITRVSTNHQAIAVCEIWAYDVWGNEEDGYEVNDRTCIERKAEILANLTICNVPVCPGAKDDFREFPDESSFTADVALCWELDQTEEFNWFSGEDNGDGDGTHYYYDDDNGKPMGEIIIIGWKPVDAS